MTHGSDLEEIRSYIAKLNDIKEAEGSTLTQVRYEECLLNDPLQIGQHLMPLHSAKESFLISSRVAGAL